MGMRYVYILESLTHAGFHYTGMTTDLRARFQKHNSGSSRHTAKYRPWKIETYIAFADDQKAIAFELYLKSGSGRAFARKRL